MVKKKIGVEAEEEEAIEPEVRTLEEQEATEVVIEKEVTSEEEEKEASEEEEVETEAARSQKMTRSSQNLKSELRTPLPRSEITDLRNFLV